MADAQVLAVPEGSVIVLRGVGYVENLDAVKLSIAQAIGHSRFAILHMGENGQAAVMDADEVIDLIRDAVKPAE